MLAKSNSDLGRFRTYLLPLLFGFLPLWLLVPLILLIHISLVPVLNHFGIRSLSYRDAAVSMVAFLGAIAVLYFVGRRLAGPAAAAIAAALGQARQLVEISGEKSAARHQQELARITSGAESRTRTLDEQWGDAVGTAAEARETLATRIQQQTARVSATGERLHRQRLDYVERGHAERVGRLKSEADVRKGESEGGLAERERKSGADYQIQWQTLAAEWKSAIQPLYEEIDTARLTAEKLFPEWRPATWKQWIAPQEFAHAARFAQMEVDVEKLCGIIPRDPRLALPGPTRFDVPLVLSFPQQGSILFETKHAGRDGVIGALNNLILRLLSTAPPGRVNFTIIDPVELGQDFAGLMHLADYEERLINSRIWTQTGQIEQQLANLSEHIEKVTQMYLRNEYATITEYNEQAGRIAEKYHFLVVADFPVNFSDLAIKRLVSIAASGAKCGVYTFIHWDQRRPAPLDFVPDELRANSVCVLRKGDEFVLSGKSIAGTTVRLDSPPDPDLATEFLHQVGRCSIDSNRVEMPFADVAPAESDLWSNDTTLELRVPIGRTGATKLQYLVLGKGTRQHALIAGKTGSGKSTLFHVIITNLSLWCSPEQVEFYLVDFKKGVEFKCYATRRLPHARVVAIESDREFGLSVLQRVDEELKRRGDLFRKLGVQDIAGYKKTGGTAPVPRTLLIIDEFQEFFVEDDRVSQNAAVLLDRIVRQGRAFGVHVLLGSQTLGGAYTLARATLGQMVVRVALQCNEADAYLIMDENNAAPRLLSRPGEAIYNDAAGTLEGNSPFQVVWLPDAIRETYLDKVRHLADRSPTAHAGPIVFEGNAPADVAENTLLRGVLEGGAIKPVTAARAWLGAPNSIKGPTEAVFHRQSGNNLLIVGQRDEAALAILAVSLISLAAQHARGTARFVLLDCS
ncbi:MAG TPA: FtsK/SpoIIIE domain-containing protein, partial [Verrucomicrobiae bacterium]|nr:FtsK/SpoIIIE domain-containing protein [Verrucomicrobiae bacterium]